MPKIGNAVLFILFVFAIAGGLSSAENNQKSQKQLLDNLARMPLPREMTLEINGLAIEKKGNSLLGKRLETLVSTMGGESHERGLISTTPLDRDLFMEIWERTKSFNFHLYENLLPKDFIERVEPNDARSVNCFYLSVDGTMLFYLDIGARQFRDDKLISLYHDFGEFVALKIDVAQARPLLPWMRKINIPNSLGYSFAMCNLYKNGNEIKLTRYYFSDADEMFINSKAAVLEKAAKASKEIKYSTCDITISIGEKDFVELWEEIKKIDFIRFINTNPEDFSMRHQEVTYSFGVNVEGRQICGWNYTDRELKLEVAKPLLRINKIMDTKISEKIDTILKSSAE